MNSSILDKDTIARPELWRLVMLIGQRSLDVALYPPVAREEILWRSFNIDPDSPSRLKAIEDTIYANPLLLSDFRRVDCIIDSSRRVIVPPCASPEQYESLLSATTAKDVVPDAMMDCPTGCEAHLIQETDPEVLPFLKRTFFNAHFHGRIPLLTKYFATCCDSMKPLRAIALIRDSRLTLIVIDHTRLLVANDFAFSNVTDAAYYLLASLHLLSISPMSDRLDMAIHGESLTAPDTLTAILRRYIPSIKAVPFPTLRFRASKSTLHIPFPLLILPICES